MPASRPRVTFDADGVCNACAWHEKKQTSIDWPARQRHLGDLCRIYRGTQRPWNVIVPCSGGKDGSYVAWRLKHDLGMNPLCVTLRPPLQTRLGHVNLENFIASGFDHLMISPDSCRYRDLCRHYFIEQGRPKWPFVMGISTAVMGEAIRRKIPFIMWGEEGEAEYGGASGAEEKMTRQYLIDCYYSGNDPSQFGGWWMIPSDEEIAGLYSTHWSKFEDWDPEIHARHAKQHCGFEMMVGGSIGTFTNYSQLDDAMQDLHEYMKFVKFGFGRCLADACIEIRRGRLSREEGVRLVNLMDGTFPLEYEAAYCDYFGMGRHEFWETIDRFASRELLAKIGPLERPWVLREPCK